LEINLSGYDAWGACYAAHSNKKALVLSRISKSCRIIAEIVLTSVLFNGKKPALTSKTVAVIFTGTQSSSSRGVTV